MGRPVVHWELWSENPDKAATFYQRVFDWNIQHIPQLEYHVVDTGGGGINGGIMKPQRGPGLGSWPSTSTSMISTRMPRRSARQAGRS